MSIFTQNTQSLYAQEYDNSDQTVEVQSDSTTDTSKDVADRPQDAGVDVMQTNGEEQEQSDDSITFEGEDSEDERDADLSDIPQSDNLNQFLTGIEISEKKGDQTIVIDKGDGANIQVNPDTEYSLKVSFEENDSLQFSDSGVYTYTLPEGISGITMTRPQAISLNMVDSSNQSFKVGASYQFIDGKLTFWINTNDANFERYKKIQNVWLNASFPFKFSSDGEKGTINWGGGQEN